MIRWFAKNDIAANLMLVAILALGLWVAFSKVPLQVEPTWEFNDVRISMEYRGATAEEVERDVVIPIEQAIKDLPGVDTIRADSSRGRASLWVSLKDSADMREMRDEIESRIGRLPTLRNQEERPDVSIPDSDSWREVITVAVMGDLSEVELRRVAEQVRDDLMLLDGISQSAVKGERPFEIAVEASQEKLRAYGITFEELSAAIRRSSLDVSAGSIDGEVGSINVRTKGQAYTRQDFEKIPVRSAAGAEVLLSEVAAVKDGFDEDRQIVRFNGVPAMMVEVMRHDMENAISISNSVREYVANAGARFPAGIEMGIWDDESISIKGRLATLGWSLLQGSILVFLVLGLFLRPALAFWVVIGIPVSFAGGVIFMPITGTTANIMSLFAFIIVVGLVVDDAIVTGENIFSHLRRGKNSLDAAVEGTKEVAVPVTFGVITTVVAFAPLMFFDGHMASFGKQIPPVVASVLLFSLIESKLILPSHLKHLKTGRKRLGPVARFQKRIADGLEWFVERVYQPVLGFATHHRYAVVALFFAGAFIMLGVMFGGHLGFQALPTVDALRIRAQIDMPTDTPLEVTDRHVKHIASFIPQLQEEFTDGPGGEPLVQDVYSETGDDGWGSSEIDTTEGNISVGILPPSVRKVQPGPRNSVIAKRWQELVGEIPEARSFHVRVEQGRRSRGSRDMEAIELELRGPASDEKFDVADQIERIFEGNDGISDAWTRSDRGQPELEIVLKPLALELGLSQQAIGSQVRQAFYGQEAQRIQRGRDDVRVMVRLTKQERHTMHTLNTLKIVTPAGGEVALPTVAEVRETKAPGHIQRIDGDQVINIGAAPKDEDVDILAIARDAKPAIDDLVASVPGLSYRYTGYIAESAESKKRMIVNIVALLFILYFLLAIPFKSLIQPLFVLLAVPFGIIGALLGHMIMDITPSHLSNLGIIALCGVVVNDSLVMVDFINRRRAEGMPLREAVLTAGGARFRPILLTSITTFAGLMPLMFATSIQAQFLIPMAVSLGYGILFATLITLFLIPAAYLITEDLLRPVRNGWRWYAKPFREEEEPAGEQAEA